KRKEKSEEEVGAVEYEEEYPEEEIEEEEPEPRPTKKSPPKEESEVGGLIPSFISFGKKGSSGQFNPPPLSLLEKDSGKPGAGDIKANANIIKRTLANFGINVEMDEISIGPSVTR